MIEAEDEADDAPCGRGVVRVDHVVNFTWGAGRLTETATDFVSIRWHGRYGRTQCSHEPCCGTITMEFQACLNIMEVEGGSHLCLLLS